MRERKRKNQVKRLESQVSGKTTGEETNAIEKEYAKLPRDWSAEERFVNRSFRIRKDIKKWIGDNLNKVYPTSSELCDECAYDCRCSPVTAYRWLHFWSNPKAPYLIEEQPAGLVLKERPL